MSTNKNKRRLINITVYAYILINLNLIDELILEDGKKNNGRTMQHLKNRGIEILIAAAQ